MLARLVRVNAARLGCRSRSVSVRCAASPDADARSLLERSFASAPAMSTGERNVLGAPLRACCTEEGLVTGFHRDGFCCTGPEDVGRHVVCAIVTEAFLKFSLSRGNDLVTPRPEFRFPGLVPGSRWCLCASRWTEALAAGVAPPVVLAACSEAALRYASLEDLQAHAADEPA